MLFGHHFQSHNQGRMSDLNMLLSCLKERRPLSSSEHRSDIFFLKDVGVWEMMLASESADVFPNDFVGEVEDALATAVIDQ